jgi:hypothetical protein
MHSRHIVLVVAVAGVALTSSLILTSRCSRAGSNEAGKVRQTALRASSQVDAAPIQVLVTKLTPQAGRVEYHYTVTNGSAFPIHTLLVGNDEYYGRPLLSRYPIGWDGDTIPSSSYQTPPGWNFAVEPTEEESLVVVKWVTSKQARPVMGGESAGGFAVILGNADPAYEAGGMWTAYLMGEEPFWGTIQSSGVTGVPLSSIFAQSDLKITPNPSGGPITIKFAMPIPGKVTVDLFDISGRRVKRIIDERRAPGPSSTSWDGRDDSGKPVASGVYFVRIKTPTTQRFGRLTWMRSGK